MVAPSSWAPLSAPSADAGAGSRVLKESFYYSAVARRDYAPGYVPYSTSLFVNPRANASIPNFLRPHYHFFGGIRGWFFGSPMGYQSCIPPNSQALYQHQGKLEITKELAHGYPYGQRVVEPLVVPEGAYSKPGGFMITGAPTQLQLGPAPEPFTGLDADCRKVSPSCAQAGARIESAIEK
jgi:hypothetical protein